MPRTHTGAHTASRILNILLLAGGTTAASAADTWWTGTASSTWSNPDNWFNNTMPGANDHVQIGWGSYHDVFVQLNVDDQIGSLRVEELSSFNSAFHTMVVNGDTVIDGRYTVLPGGDGDLDPAYLQIQGSPGAYFETDNLTLNNAFMNMWYDGRAVINGQLNSSARSVIRAHGDIEFNGTGTNFVNEGRVVPYSSQSKGPLRFIQNDTGLFDLDGATGGGRIEMNYYDSSEAQGADLRFYGYGLADSFSSSIDMTSDSNLHMNLVHGWVADSNSEINMYGSIAANGEAARIHGGDFEFAGAMNVDGTDARLRVHSANTTLTPQARVSIGADDVVQFGDFLSESVTIEGGTYTLDEGAQLEFWSDINVQGGEFTTASESPADGAVTFRGDSHWTGETTFNGFARVNETAAVNGLTTINADRFDMDGADNQTVWDINARLNLNADTLGSAGNNVVHGELNIAGGFSPRLTVDTDSDVWTSFGEINLTGGIISATRIAGDTLRVGGDLGLPSGNATITAETIFLSSAEIDLTAPSARLRLNADSYVLGGATFVGDGTLWNNAEMTLRNGVDLNDIGLQNSGDLRLGNDVIEAAAVGVVGADAFVNQSEAAYIVSLGGHTPGLGHDLLTIGNGGTSLAGNLLVEHVDLGGGLFLPEIGDEFLVLTSVASITGMFQNDPVSFADGLEYHWEVLHFPNAVVLRLDSIMVPAPASLACLGVLLIARRRRVSIP